MKNNENKYEHVHGPTFQEQAKIKTNFPANIITSKSPRTVYSQNFFNINMMKLMKLRLHRRRESFIRIQNEVFSDHLNG